uniref:Uncharacterized protein n=1 Tax=Leersia perrieri TaxID=77586 RepID=A0A0D9X7B6_9ORYZ
MRRLRNRRHVHVHLSHVCPTAAYTLSLHKKIPSSPLRRRRRRRRRLPTRSKPPPPVRGESLRTEPHVRPRDYAESSAPPPPLGGFEMESMPLTTEAIAFTEKKMDMTLDDIIKMSKKKPGGKKPSRQPIKKRPFQNGNTNQGNAKVQQFMESRSSIRQGVLAQRRTNLSGNQFSATKQAAKKAATMPIRSRGVRLNKPSATSNSVQRRPVGEAFQNGKGKEVQNQAPRTMDALFAQMKQQRMRTMPQQQTNTVPGRQFAQQRRNQQQRRGRGRGRNGGNL